MKAKLTKEMIDTGIKEDQSRCPIALLMKECYPGANKVLVDVDTPEDTPIPWVKVDNHIVAFLNPLRVADIITRFDNGKKVNSCFLEWEDF